MCEITILDSNPNLCVQITVMASAWLPGCAKLYKLADVLFFVCYSFHNCKFDFAVYYKLG